MSRIVCHFSCGAASAVSTKIALAEYAGQDVVIVYAETGSEDWDNERFLVDAEAWFGRAVVRLRSDKYASTWQVWERRKWIANVHGAECTRALKIGPQLAFQLPDDVHVFGYTSDSADQKRAITFRENWPELDIRTPLIDRGLDKSACLALLISAGIDPPRTYAMGLPNANCIPCCKATSPSYWALIRQHFPDEFARMDELSRRLGARLARVQGERVFIGDIPEDWPVTEAIAPACDLMCQLSEQELMG